MIQRYAAVLYQPLEYSTGYQRIVMRTFRTVERARRFLILRTNMPTVGDRSVGREPWVDVQDLKLGWRDSVGWTSCIGEESIPAVYVEPSISTLLRTQGYAII